MKTTAKTFKMSVLAGIFWASSLISCDQEKFQYIPASVDPYNEVFRAEAQKRGVRLNYDLIIEWTSDKSVHGTAKKMFLSNNVRITLNEEIWESYAIHPLRREYIFMHELGHAVLGRDHNESKSFMNIGTWELIDYANAESEETRAAYFDELFSQEK